jgi:glycosyltransferase involved in cell wall biosynthesis
LLKLVTELELTKPQEPLFVDSQYGCVWTLVTFRGVPLCAFELECDPGVRTISAQRLRNEAMQRSGWIIWQKALEKSFEQPDTSFPPVSVVVCTRDRPRMLKRCLESLLRLDYPEYEVIVIDNCSRDAKVAAVIEQAGVRSVRENRPGLDWARNRGFEGARHDIISYIDDDAVASPGWLRGIARGFQDPSVMAVTGLVFPAELDTEAQLLFERYGGMSKGLTASSFTAATLPDLGIFAAHNFGVGANMAFRRQVFANVGAFDTMLDTGTPSGGAGDVDMFYRVLAAGLKIRYEPDALIWHTHRRSREGLRRQIYANGKSYGIYLIKTWRAGRTPGAAKYAARWMSGWVMRRLLWSILGLEDFPLDLLWAEFRGALHAPWAYLATMKNDKRIRLSHNSAVSEEIG